MQVKLSARNVICGLPLFALLGSSLSARAEFLNLYRMPYGIVETSQGPRQVYRLYAYFSEGADQVVRWGGNGNLKLPMDIRSVACGSQLAGNFYNAGFLTAPSQQDIDRLPSAQWDTFATIGVNIADQGSGSPPFPTDTTALAGITTFIQGNQLISYGKVYLQAPTGSPSAAQGRADYAGDGDPGLRVSLGQFTVPVGDGIRIVLGELVYQNAAGNLITLHNVGAWTLEDGRCCWPDGTCSFVVEMSCWVGGGTFIGCQSCTLCPPPKPPCSGDVSPSGGDDEVNVQDMLAVINTWGACAAPCVTDLNSDGTVNVADLSVVIKAWGSCP